MFWRLTFEQASMPLTRFLAVDDDFSFTPQRFPTTVHTLTRDSRERTALWFPSHDVTNESRSKLEWFDTFDGTMPLFDAVHTPSPRRMKIFHIFRLLHDAQCDLCSSLTKQALIYDGSIHTLCWICFYTDVAPMGADYIIIHMYPTYDVFISR
jgi:hypothetical protein